MDGAMLFFATKRAGTLVERKIVCDNVSARHNALNFAPKRTAKLPAIQIGIKTQGHIYDTGPDTMDRGL